MISNDDKKNGRLSIGLKLNDTNWVLWEFAMTTML